MISRVRLENFRGHGQTEIPLQQLTLLVGDNAVGKTSVLRGIHALGRLMVGEKGALHSEDLRLEAPNQLRTTAMELKLTAFTRDESIELSTPDPDRLERAVLTWNSVSSQGQVTFRELDARKVPEFVVRMQRSMRSTGILRLDPEVVAASSVSPDIVPKVGSRGEGLASALLYLKVSEPSLYRSFELAMKECIPTLEDFAFARVKMSRPRSETLRVEGAVVALPDRTEEFIGEQVRMRFVGTDFLPATSASEGTLITLALLTLLHMPNCPPTILLDDIERGLHPRAQAELVSALRAILKTRPETQIVATSHSPYLVDAFKSEEVVVLSRKDTSGGVVARRLIDHPDSKLVKTLTTGEFLNSSGKDWFGL